ncbi:MAG TPA: endolytic transglycosylase MltG [Rhizomicrobium sp.]
MPRIFVVVLILAAILGGALLFERINFASPGPAARHGSGSTVVLVAPGQHLLSISQKLEAAGVVRSALVFALGARLRAEGTELKAGEYAIPSRASMDDVAAILISGKSIEYKVTVAEGLTSQMIYNIVKGDPALAGDPGPVPPEGSLLPETYLYTRGAARSEILARMRNAREKLLDRMWRTRAPNLPFRTPQEAVTLASIVEKETAIPEERRHIASVFVNRLRLNMKLQSDPTIIYGISKGYPLGRGIRESEINAHTPYNTYVVTGLPPTPICNPGRDAIAAVLNPKHSPDLYFVADGTGGHVFTPSVAEHERNVAKWRRIENALNHPAH